MSEVKIKRIKNVLSFKDFIFLDTILKTENSESLLSSLSENLLNKYLKILVKSENIFLYLCEYKNENIGYAILSKQPSFLIDEFKSLRFSIILELIFGLKFRTLTNVLISVLKVDSILLSQTKREMLYHDLLCIHHIDCLHANC